MHDKHENDCNFLAELERKEEVRSLKEASRYTDNRDEMLQDTQEAARKVLAAYERLEDQYQKVINRNAVLQKVNITLFWLALLQKDGAREYHA